MKAIDVRGGGVKVAEALVDDEDFTWASEYRWRLHDAGYAQRSYWADGRRGNVYLHRMILGLEAGDPRQGDHINGNRLDNRRENLRIVSHRANTHNRVGVAGGTSRFRGVHWNSLRKLWVAKVKVNYKPVYLGDFSDEIEAAIAAQAFRDRHWPHARPDAALEAALRDRELPKALETA